MFKRVRVRFNCTRLAFNLVRSRFNRTRLAFKRVRSGFNRTRLEVNHTRFTSSFRQNHLTRPPVRSARFTSRKAGCVRGVHPKKNALSSPPPIRPCCSASTSRYIIMIYRVKTGLFRQQTKPHFRRENQTRPPVRGVRLPSRKARRVRGASSGKDALGSYKEARAMKRPRKRRRRRGPPTTPVWYRYQ